MHWSSCEHLAGKHVCTPCWFMGWLPLGPFTFNCQELEWTGTDLTEGLHYEWVFLVAVTGWSQLASMVHETLYLLIYRVETWPILFDSLVWSVILGAARLPVSITWYIPSVSLTGGHLNLVCISANPEHVEIFNWHRPLSHLSCGFCWTTITWKLPNRFWWNSV